MHALLVMFEAIGVIIRGIMVVIHGIKEATSCCLRSVKVAYALGVGNTPQ